MKKLLISGMFSLYCMLGWAQQPVAVEISEKNMSKGSQMAVTVLVPEAKTKQIIPVWEKYVNNRSIGKRMGNLATSVGNIFRSDEKKVSRDILKVQKKGDELYVRAIQEPNITSHPVDVYAKVTELPDGSQLSAFFQYTDSVFMNESNIDKERVESIKSYMHEFGVEAYKSVVDDQIKAAKKVVAQQERIAKKIESSSRKAEKAISRYEVDIQEYESGIQEVNNDIKRMEDNIGLKNAAFSGLTKATPEYDVAKAELKNLGKEKSKNFSKIKSLKNKIKSKEQNIKSSKGKIAKNESKIAKQQAVIEEKEAIVDQLNRKKEEIK